MNKYDYSSDYGKTWTKYGSVKHYLITIRSFITRPFTNKYQIKYIQFRYTWPNSKDKIKVKLRDAE